MEYVYILMRDYHGDMDSSQIVKVFSKEEKAEEYLKDLYEKEKISSWCEYSKYDENKNRYILYGDDADVMYIYYIKCIVE